MQAYISAAWPKIISSLLSTDFKAKSTQVANTFSLGKSLDDASQPVLDVHNLVSKKQQVSFTD